MGFEETKTKPKSGGQHKRISLPAELPSGMHGVFPGSVGIVKLSMDPFREIRELAVEVVRDAVSVDWDDVEELVYCYIGLNSPELHPVIEDAFFNMFRPSRVL